MLWKYIEEKMLQHPSSNLMEEGVSMTYEEAVIFAKAFAQSLDGSCYAILCRSELFSALAVLSCIAAGVPFVPMPYRYGRKHCEKIFNTIHPEYAITDVLGELQVVELEEGAYRKPEGEQPAAILCTSGTTGAPKGVMLSERNLLTNLMDIRRYFAVGPMDKILIARPLYHCAVLTGEFFISLCRGVNICFFNGGLDPAGILQVLKKEGITVLCGTPTMLSALARFGRRATAASAVRTIAVSGECLDTARARFIENAFPAAKIYHVYGLTEASPRVTFLPAEQFAADGTCVGYPLHSVRLRVVDRRGKPVFPGEAGELCVQSESVMLGYYDDPAGTAAVLRGGWLHTGDMAVMRRDGLVKIQGRKDNMIIRGGMNIYPQEIEKTLAMDPRFLRCWLTASPMPCPGKKLAFGL